MSWICLTENMSPSSWILQDLLLFRPTNVNWIDFEVHRGFARVKVEQRLKDFFSTEQFDPISLTKCIRLIFGDTFKNSRNQQKWATQYVSKWALLTMFIPFAVYCITILQIAKYSFSLQLSVWSLFLPGF